MEYGLEGCSGRGTDSDSSANISALTDHRLTTVPAVANVQSDSPYSKNGYWLSKRRDGRSSYWMIARWERGTVIYRSCRTVDLRTAKQELDRYAADAEAGQTATLTRRAETVYFIRADTGQIKIGIARDVGIRLAQIRTMSPIGLELLAICDGGQPVEFNYHRRFAEHRLHGEWFNPHPDILAEIERLKEAA